MSELTVEEIKDISRDYYDAEETITGFQNENIELQAKVEELQAQVAALERDLSRLKHEADRQPIHDGPFGR